MEGELGIDSIKQAEIMAEIRDRFSLPIDEDFTVSAIDATMGLQ